MKYICHQFYIFLSLLLCVASSCSTGKQLSREARRTLLADTAISKGFIGISIYDPVKEKYLYNYNADKYFIPASNTKLFTLYAGMKYLGDSLTGIRYYDMSDSDVVVLPAGDPTFLDPEFSDQPVTGFLKNVRGKIFLSLTKNKFEKYGPGWAWNDYGDDYMVERSALPVYGNVTTIFFKDDTLQFIPARHHQILMDDRLPVDQVRNKAFLPFHRKNLPEKFSIIRSSPDDNSFRLIPSSAAFTTTQLPLKLDNNNLVAALRAAINKTVTLVSTNSSTATLHTIHSQPSDTLFKRMMHRSDNFFAEQTLLMASDARLGYMSDADMIDTLLKHDLADMPRRPVWVDGSGLSRYNLFTPQDMIYILLKMKKEFGLARMEHILPTGGEGTLKNYFIKDAGAVYAKTGTLSNNCALSGYIITKKNKLLLFSIIANHYHTGAAPVRRAVEKFVEYIISEQ